MSDKCRAAQRHRLSVVQHLVDGMLFAARFDGLKRRNVLSHRHHLGAGSLFDQGITFLMIAMCVVSQQDLSVGEFEPQLRDRLFNRRHISFIRAVDEDISLWCNDEKGAEGLRSDVVDIADDLVGRELRRLVLRRTHVACQDRSRCVGLSVDRDRRVVGSRLARRLGLRRIYGCGKNSREQRELIVLHEFVPGELYVDQFSNRKNKGVDAPSVFPSF